MGHPERAVGWRVGDLPRSPPHDSGRTRPTTQPLVHNAALPESPDTPPDNIPLRFTLLSFRLSFFGSYLRSLTLDWDISFRLRASKAMICGRHL